MAATPPSTGPAPTSPHPPLTAVAQIASRNILTRSWQTAVHPRLPFLATCTAAKTVDVFSLSTFTHLSSISGGHKRSIRSVAWKPNLTHESILATGSFDASVGIWRRDDDFGSGSGGGDGGGGADELDFTRGEGGEGEEEEEWRFALVLDGHDSEVKSVAWSAGGNLLATCARDKSVWVWEEVGDEDYETVAVLQEHTADVKCVAWHPEEELLASGSYDDDIRLWREDVDDWDCVAVLKGHDSTVWCVEFEGIRPRVASAKAGDGQEGQAGRLREAWTERRELAGPRLVSCSDDKTVRVWRRVPKERKAQNTMSIIRTGSIEEEWVEEAQLPVAHGLAICSVAWSKETGRIASTGADGKVVVYEERWAEGVPITTGDSASSEDKEAAAATELADRLDGSGRNEERTLPELNGLTSWHVVAEQDVAHGVHEVNHVTWSRRLDKGKSRDDEEILISTGDDGAVNVWTVEA